MKKNFKKVLSLALTLIMIFAVSVSAFAITLDDAKEVARKDSGKVIVNFTEAKVDDGNFEIEFTALDGEYDYEINNDGLILSKSVDLYKLNKGTEKKKEAAAAKAAALEYHGKTDVKAIRASYDAEENEYEVEFIDGAKRFDYEVSAYDADVVGYGYELIAGGNESIAGVIAMLEELFVFFINLFSK